MENNWKEKIMKIIDSNMYIDGFSRDNAIEEILELTNSVFEATKKECADKVRLYYIDLAQTETDVDKESILNVNKPNI